MTVAGSTRSATASARPASSAGVLDRLESTLTGWVRPPSSITASIGAMSPPSMSSGSQPGAIVGPLYALTSTCTAVTLVPLRRTWSARSLIRAASRYQVSWPVGAADSVGSPPPLSTTSPGAPVGCHHLRGEPGVAVQPEQRRGGGQHLGHRRRLHRHVGALRPQLGPGGGIGDPAGEVAQVRIGERQRQGRGQLVGGRLSARVGHRLDPGVGRRQMPGPAGSRWRRWDWPPVSTAAAATTAATTSRTATPITTWVDRRHWVGRMILLTPACQSRVSVGQEVRGQRLRGGTRSMTRRPAAPLG